MGQPEDVDLPAGDPAQQLVDRAVLVVPQHAPGQPDHDWDHHHRQHQDRHGEALAVEVADKEQRQAQTEQELKPDRAEDDDPGVLQRTPDARINQGIAVVCQPDEGVVLALQSQRWKLRLSE